MKITQVSVDMMECFAGLGLMTSQKLAYMYLRINPKVVNHGLYELRLQTMARDLDVTYDQLLSDVRILTGTQLITWDNGLIFVPAISKECRFDRYTHRHKMLMIACRNHGMARSEIGGPNKSVARWISAHAELLDELRPEEYLNNLASDLRGYLGDPSKPFATQDYPTSTLPDPTATQDYPINTNKHAANSTKNTYIHAISDPTSTLPDPTATQDYPTTSLPDPTATQDYPRLESGSSCSSSSSEDGNTSTYSRGGTGGNFVQAAHHPLTGLTR